MMSVNNHSNLRSPATEASDAVVPAAHLWVRLLRLGMGSALLFQALGVWPDLKYIATWNAIVPTSIAELVNPRWFPRVGWFAPLLAHVGLDGPKAFVFFFALYTMLLIALIVNFYPKITSLLVFVLHLVIAGSIYFTLYGVDRFASIGLFYCVIAPGRIPLPERSDVLWRSRAVRCLLQFHLLVLYWTAGIAKSFGPQWWHGEAVWMAVTQPIYRGAIDVASLAALPGVAVVAGISTLVIEIGYPFFMLPKTTRPVWLAAVMSMHLGIGLFMDMWSFAFVMIALNVGGFGSEYVAELLNWRANAWRPKGRRLQIERAGKTNDATVTPS
jgi:hypothetical protein